MNELFFWNQWERPFRLSFKLLIAIAILLMVVMLYFILFDHNLVFGWIATVFLEYQPLVIQGHDAPLIESLVSTEMPIIFQRFSSQYTPMSEWFAYGFLAVFYLAVMGCMTVVTYLTRYYYIGAMGLWMLFVAFAGFSKLTVFGLENELGIGLIAIPFMALAYYFNTVREDISWGKRFGSFLLLSVMFGILIEFGSVYDQPFLMLAYHAFIPSLIISVAFVFLISQEIILAILTLTTKDSSDESSQNTKHFIILSVVYLANLVLLYLNNTGYIDWDIYYINEFILLSVSAILGVWGIKQREVLYGGILGFKPNVAYLYGFLAIICFVTVIFQSMSANDPAIEAMEDAIVFGHIGFGGMFFLYIILNFISFLIKNLPVHRIAFKEDNFPYITARIGGLLAVAAFFFVSNKAAFNQAVAGFYNGLGDAALIQGNNSSAQFYYNEGFVYSATNHKSNAILGLIKEKDAARIRHLKYAKGKNPLPETFVNLGQAYEKDNQFFEAIFAYQEGLKIYPGSEQISTNLALLYNKTDVIDSALYYTEGKSISDWIDKVRWTDRAGIAAMHGLSIDHIVGSVDLSKIAQADIYSNLLAAGIRDKDPGFERFMKSSSTQLNLITSSYLINWGLWSYFNDDIAFLNSIDAYILDVKNVDFVFALKYVKALNLIKQGYASKAFELIDELRGISEDESGKYEMMLGKWCLQRGAHYQASKFFELARENGYPDATMDLAKAYTLIDNSSVGQFILRQQLNMETGPQRIEQINDLISNIENKSFAIAAPKFDVLATQIQNALDDDEVDQDHLFELAGRDPFYQEGVLQGVDYFNNTAKDQDKAYDLLVKAVAINEYSELLNKAYIQQCLRVGLVNYAESAMLRLKEVMDIEAYDAFEIEYEKSKTAQEASLENW